MTWLIIKNVEQMILNGIGLFTNTEIPNILCGAGYGYIIAKLLAQNFLTLNEIIAILNTLE